MIHGSDLNLEDDNDLTQWSQYLRKEMIDVVDEHLLIRIRIQTIIDNGVFTEISDRKDIKSIDDYKKALMNEEKKMWGLELELAILSIVLDAPLVVLNHTGAAADKIVTGKNYFPAQTLTNKPIVMWFLNGHYECVCPEASYEWDLFRESLISTPTAVAM